MFKLIIPIQSLSDVVTNSSSELFCTIFSDTQLDEIHDIFDNLFGYNDDSEMSPAVYFRNKDKDDDYYEDYPESWLEIWLPYGYECTRFMKAGIEAVLKERFNDYEVKMEEY